VNISETWIRRPVMTVLVMAGVLLFGLLGYRQLPINNLPDVDFPTITVTANLPGASPETMAATVATPLEKKFSAVQGLDSMTSTSTLGSTSINLQFSLDRPIDAAALDVNAAISAAMGVLPRNLPNPPTFKKVNPADMGILFLALYSDSLPAYRMHDFAENRVVPLISQVPGVADIDVVPNQKYAVRVRFDPRELASKNVSLSEAAAAVQSGNVFLPGGTLDGFEVAFTLEPDGQLTSAAAYNNLIIAYRDGRPVRVRDVGQAEESFENDKTRATLYHDGKRSPCTVLRIRKQPGANTTETADRIKARLAPIQAQLPAGMGLEVIWDQSSFIRESILDVQFTMLFTIFLVVLVVLLFLRSVRSTLNPTLVSPLALVAVFPLMSLLGYTLNNLSMMALTLAIGYVVDDAIVVLENIMRRVESGQTRLEAAIRGSREIGFTILSMTVSLAVVFIPIMFMGGLLGRLFREFAVCITAAILFSGIFSLTLTPMLCSRFLSVARPRGHAPGGPAARPAGPFLRAYRWCLLGCMRLKFLALLLTAGITWLAVGLFQSIPKGFVPNQDQNVFRVFSQASDRTSYAKATGLAAEVFRVLTEDPELAHSWIANINGFGTENTTLAFVSLRPREERDVSVDEVIARLRPKLARFPNLAVSLVNPPLITIGSRMATAQWQFTLQSTDMERLFQDGSRLEARMRELPYLTDVKSDLQMRKPKIRVLVDRDHASTLGLSMQEIEESFFTAYGTRQVSTIYSDSNFYYVITELLPQFRDEPTELPQLHLKAASGEMVPLSAIASFRQIPAPLAVNHYGQIPSASIWFNLAPGYSIGAAIDKISELTRETIHPSISTAFQGTAQAFQSSLSGMGFLLLITVILIYLILGMLYESFIHPLTILNSLPLARFGALAALWLFGLELDLYAYVGIIMLVGIVKKNGIMMVDYALEAAKARNLATEPAIVEACLARCRPIMMTTFAALFGALPIALGFGAGGDARRPLGVAVVGGLVFSQFLTLFITPVFYVYMDRLSGWLGRRSRGEAETAPGPVPGGGAHGPETV